MIAGRIGKAVCVRHVPNAVKRMRLATYHCDKRSRGKVSVSDESESEDRPERCPGSLVRLHSFICIRGIHAIYARFRCVGWTRLYTASPRRDLPYYFFPT